jgi:uncharacterized protein (DUF1800 family)
MALDPIEAAVALHRFGFGPRAGSIAALASDPRGALLSELDRPNAGQIANAGLMPSGQISRVAFEFNQERQAKERVEARRKEAEKQEAAKRAAEGAAMDNGAMEKSMEAKSMEAKSMEAKSMEAKSMEAPAPAAPPNPPPQTPMRENFIREGKAHYDAAINAEIGFVERLVWFWSNHFCVNADTTVMAGAYEREAIRPHVLGRFVDMLLAAESHPAMLIYLDNAQSTGPNSVAGIMRNRGLNENLAREILELHTLGVRTVYTQEDVTSFAKVITGWTLLTTDTNPHHGGEFLYHPRMHEPGAQTVLGKSYRDTGQEQGRSVLTDLARHPATAKHIATKLARHFIADEPPAALVERLTQKFTETEGDLWEVSKALLAAPESWAPERAKIKRPSEWYVAMRRAAGFSDSPPGPILQGTNRLGEPLWRPPAPRGFSDDNGAWLDGLAHRLDSANAFAQNTAARLDPNAVMETALGPLASPETRQAVARAESKAQALTFVLMAPEFQRR